VASRTTPATAAAKARRPPLAAAALARFPVLLARPHVASPTACGTGQNSAISAEQMPSILCYGKSCREGNAPAGI
jgi:hypothetical protein